MDFSLATGKNSLVLNLTRNDHARLDLIMSDESGEINNDYASRFAVYYSVEQGASLLIECEASYCFLHGTIEIKGIQYQIEQDHSSENFQLHTIRRKALPNLDELMKSVGVVSDDGEAYETPSDAGLSIRKRRSVSAFPDCDIIEVKALVDDTIWDYYKDRYGGDETRALDEIYKYFTSTFAEVDYRLHCLTDYFTHYDGTCVVKCLRVILVAIEITKTSSWTDGNFKTVSGVTFVKGLDGLSDCGTLNENMANSQDGWHHLSCFTRENLALYSGSWDNTYRTVAKQNKMCSSNLKYRVAVHEATGDGVDITVAHALLRTIGARDDASQSCSPNGYFLMREPKADWPENPGFFGQNWYLSDCTTEDICNYVNGLNPNCMRVRGNLVNETIWKEWEKTPLPGEILSADEQCKVRWGNDSVQCGDLYPEDMCGQYIRCTSTSHQGCVCKLKVSSETPCGYARVCKKGQCVFIKDVPLGGKCECHSQCAGNNTACDPDTGLCVCKEGFFDSNGIDDEGGNCTEKFPLEEECDEDVQCKDPNALCINGTCKCRPCYYNNNGRCEKQSCLGKSCNVTAQCKGENTVCDPERDICVCETGFFVDDEGNCVTVNGTICDPCIQQPDSCTQDGTTCSDRGFCECSNNTVEVNGQCFGMDICEPCDPSDSTCASGLVCSSSTNRCECPPDQVQIGDQCYGTRVAEPCTPVLPTCVDYFAECNGTVCDCKPGYTWNGSICVGEDPCDPCDPSTPACGTGLVCNPNTYRCECPPDEVQIGDNCFGIDLCDPCDPETSSCDSSLVCNPDTYRCECPTNQVQIGDICCGSELCEPCDPSANTCNANLVCSSITYRCECPTNQVQYGDACYGTLVTEVCTTALDTCTDKYADCNGTICDCVDGFTWNGSKCVGEAICDPCDPLTPSCDNSLVCNPDTYKCECPPGLVQIGAFCYGTRVTEACTTALDTCIDDDAGCNGTVCDCLEDFVWNGSICIGNYLCDPCDPSTTSCDSNLVCNPNTYRCECPTDQVQIGDECFGISLCDPCDPSTPSCDTSLVCNPNTYRCECPTDQVQIGDECFGISLCDPCDPSTPSCDTGLECNPNTYRCECPTDQVQIGDECFGLCLCDPCDPSTPSCDTSLVCNPNTYRCECPTDQVQIGDECFGISLCDPCDPSTPSCDTGLECNPNTYRCECPSDQVQIGDECFGEDLCDPSDSTCSSPLVCSSDTYRCECPPGYVQIDGSCYGTLVTEECTTTLDTCVDKYADCNGTICDCIPGFSWNGSECLGPDLCDPCDPLQSPSSCNSEFVCSSDTYRCECPPTQAQVGDQCVGTRVTEPCTTTPDTCTDNYAECNGTVCDCEAGFIWNGSYCVGPDLCNPCDPLTLSCDGSLVCSSDTYRCQCPSNEVQIGNDCYGTRVTEACTNVLDTCIDDNAGCNGTICDCLPGFTWNGLLCVGSELCDPCDPHDSTCTSPLVCSSTTDRCECPTGQVQIGDACYGTLVTEPCTTALPTCVDYNAECNGTVCDCMPGFTWNGTMCSGEYLCEPCDPSLSTCQSGLVCSSNTYRCECPPDQVQIGDSCYGTRVTEVCTTANPTCIDNNAECNGTVCDCVDGFYWNGSKCVGENLCEPCDPSSSTCAAPLVCSSSTYRCECPPGQVQVGDECYGRLVTESCTIMPDTCIDDNAGCNGTICDCLMGYVWNGSKCVGDELCNPCDASTLLCSGQLVCSSDTYRCECPTNQVQIGDACYGTLVTEACTTALPTCVDYNAECNGTVCDCIPTFIWNGSICLGPNLWDPCDPSTPSCDSSLVCNPNTYRCECPADQVQIGDMCYGLYVTEACTTTLDTCVDDYADCNGTICDCKPGFTWTGSKCVGTDLCDPCDPSMSTCSTPLVCGNSSNRCECPPDQVQIGEECYGTLVTEPCTTVLDTCIDNFADCNGTVCDCISGLSWNGSKCVGENLCEPCDPSDSTCSSPLVCSSNTYRCECPPDEVQIGDACC
ncbi:neurogenic locus notch homolog protein 1-like [Mercenaria mercenaria]|uniref:neurogenic locus notch homolog protein 1-like n=1 Tax=Mercenaria mercenaria TaxID=6596 RepID=UPI00234F9C34|nr:neurogenic locus notch homolog protein 1-like [Mercenaria mercenaria]